ncbi:MAG: TetR/AcrR family transcriptional regulator [Nannocystaceae bacterium]
MTKSADKKAKRSAENRRRAPSQARSRATVEAILTATAQILSREGPDAATTKAIAARAGVSIGSLYQYFGGLDEIIDTLARRHVDEMRAVLSDALAELIRLPIDEAVPRLMQAMITSHQVDPTLDHVLHRLQPMQDGTIMDEFRDFSATVAAAALRSHPDVEVDDPELVGAFLTEAVGGVLKETLRRFPERLEDPTLERALCDLVLGFLARQRRDA